jgi:hypothetical protein
MTGATVRYGKSGDTNRRTASLRRAARFGLLLLTAIGTGAAAAHGAHKPRVEQPARMAIQVNDDRLTVSVAKVPQIYLYGVIDAEAPKRFEALVRSGKIPSGSDIYLNSPNGDLTAGLALGRLFRAGSMTTHLGTPRRKGRAGYRGAKEAICTEACVYAYLGGLYRWAPTGGDRIGLGRSPANAAMLPGSVQTPVASAGLGDYLKTMGIDPDALGPMPASTPGAPIWWTADRMTLAGLANNGRLPLKAKAGLLPPTPFLQLDQDDRQGSHRLVLQCRPGNITLIASEQVGTTRARQIVSHATRSYFEVDRQEVLARQRDGTSVVDGAVVITRPYPPADLVHLLSAHTVGAWVAGRTNAFRYGFAFTLYPARDAIKDFYNACWRAAPWPARPAPGKG